MIEDEKHIKKCDAPGAAENPLSDQAPAQRDETATALERPRGTGRQLAGWLYRTRRLTVSPGAETHTTMERAPA